LFSKKLRTEYSTSFLQGKDQRSIRSHNSQSCRGATGSSAQARSRSRRAQRQARTACSWRRSRPRRRRCTGTWRVITYSVSTPTLRPKKNTVVLAASLRSALRIRCWCCITTLCLCYLRWCRQHHILTLFQDNGTRLRRAGRLRQISQDSMHTSRRLPGPWTRVLGCTFRAAYARSSLFTRCAASSLPSCTSS